MENQPQPKAQDGNPLVATILFSLFTAAAFSISIGASLDRYELYSTGVIAGGKVLSVESAHESYTLSNGKGRSSTHITEVFDHDVQYAGSDHWIRQEKKIAAGTKVKVFYSTVNPKNAVISSDGKPWSFFRVLARPEIIFPLIFGLFTLFVAVHSFKELRKQKQPRT